MPKIPVLGWEEKDAHTLSLLPNPSREHAKSMKHHQDMKQTHKDMT